MDPGEFDEARYRASLLRKMRASEVVVYQAEFAPASVAAEPTLVAATSTGRLHVFRLRHIMVLGRGTRTRSDRATEANTLWLIWK